MQDLIADLEQQSSLFEPDQLHERIEALDRFDVHNLDMPPPGADPRFVALYSRAVALRSKLEAANFEVYAAIRRAIRSGRGQDALLRWVQASPPDEREGYDHMDELIAGVFEFSEPLHLLSALTPEMVPYQPTPGRHIFDLLRRAELGEDDVLIDLGSGLGQVALLTAICTPARACGIEIEPVYVGEACRAAKSLDLERVAFVREDAREADLTEGTVFYLYTPFRGQILRTVLDRLRHEAAGRRIRVCTFGPCAAILAAEAWLESPGLVGPGRISIFKSCRMYGRS